MTIFRPLCFTGADSDDGHHHDAPVQTRNYGCRHVEFMSIQRCMGTGVETAFRYMRL